MSVAKQTAVPSAPLPSLVFVGLEYSYSANRTSG